MNNSFPSLANVSDEIIVIISGGPDESLPVQCSWLEGDTSNKVFQGQWVSSFTCNGTSSGLSTAAKAGIGVGVGIGGLIIFVTVILCCLKRLRKGFAAEVSSQAH